MCASGYKTDFMMKIEEGVYCYKTIQELQINTIVSHLKTSGCLRAVDDFAHVAGNGEYYVYVWFHLGGEPFYIGSGKGKRWLSKVRNDDFPRQLDRGDAVVYKVLSGVDKKTALAYERYLAFCVSWVRDSLVNKDNNLGFISVGATVENIGFISEMENDYLTTKVEEAFVAILSKNAFSESSAIDIFAINRFLKHYGETYFSNRPDTDNPPCMFGSLSEMPDYLFRER